MCRFHRIYDCWETLLDYGKLFSPDDYQKNDKMIYQYFKNKYGKKTVKPNFRRETDKPKKFVLEQITKHNDLINKNIRKCVTLYAILKSFLLVFLFYFAFVSVVSSFCFLLFCGFIFISWYSCSFSDSAVRLKTFKLTAGIKKWKSIIKNKRKKHDNTKL